MSKIINALLWINVGIDIGVYMTTRNLLKKKKYHIVKLGGRDEQNNNS
jgi:hypothetical protein